MNESYTPATIMALTRQVNETTGGVLTEPVIRTVLDIYWHKVTENLRNGNAVDLPNLGKLVVVTGAPRKGRNPRTGLNVTIPAKRRVKFHAHKSLTPSLNS